MSKEMAALGLYTEAAMGLLLHAKLLGVDTPAAPADAPAGKPLEASVTVQAHVLGVVGVAPGCHGDCRGPKGSKTGPWGQGALLPELDAGGVSFPRQTVLARRERIYELAIELFDAGQQWELALELADALLKQYSQVRRGGRGGTSPRALSLPLFSLCLPSSPFAHAQT